MSNTPVPLVDVAVVLIANPERDKLLLDFNEKWGDFTFPMTKLGELPGPTPGSPAVPETAAQAALRAAVEVVGSPLPPTRRPDPLPYRVEPYHRSGRDGVWKRYQYHLFVLNTTTVPRPLPGHAAVWVSPADVETHEPVSPTVRAILTAVPPAALGL